MGSPAQNVSAMLAQTNKGRLSYDREWSPPKSPLASMPTSPSILLSPVAISPRSSSNLSVLSQTSCGLQSVLEEVANELHEMKVQSIYEVAVEMGRRKARSKMGSHQTWMEATIGPNARQREDIPQKKAVPQQVAKNTPDAKTKVNESKIEKEDSLVSSPVAHPVEDELLLLEDIRRSRVLLKCAERRQQVNAKLNQMRKTSIDQITEKLRVLAEERRRRDDAAAKEAQHSRYESSVHVLQNAQEERSRKVFQQLQAARENEEKERASSLEHVHDAVKRLGEALELLESEVASVGGDVVTSMQSLLGAGAQALAEGKGTLALLSQSLAAARDEPLGAEVTASAHEIGAKANSLTLQIRERRQQIEVQRRLKEKQEEERKAAAIAQANQPNQPVPVPQQPQQSQQPPLAAATSQPALQEQNRDKYDQFAHLLSSWNNSLQPLVSIEALKPFVFACQKAVNVPVNAVGSVSSSHLKDKLDKLEALLSGQPVEVVGKSTKFSATEHQLGIAFCKNLLAKKLVDQGADVVSSKPEQAFSMAFVVVALWNKFPDFGTLFLAHLYKTCPYLLPCHFVRAPSMTDAEYYKLLGYKHDGDGVEEQTMFIKRMSGLARLYAAIAVSTLPKAKADEDHPHGLGNIWRWMAAVMNTTPINDVTATLLSEVLEITGYAMLNSYGIHFRKLLVAIQRDFIPAIRSVTLEGSGGPVQRLQLFLEKFAQSGIIKKASGMLAPGFL